MYLLLLILSTIKVYARINIFKVVTRKHGHDIVKIERKLEDLLTKHQKNGLDIKFIITCKRENLTPTFATVNLAMQLKNGTMRLKKKIARAIMNVELQKKHKEKRNLKKQILETSSQLKRCLTNIIYITMLHQINKAINSKIKAVSACQLRKLEKLRLCQNNVSPRKNKTYILNIQFAICHHGLDHQIPLKTNPNLTYTEFESYFQGTKHKITNLPKIQILHLKTKLCNTYEQYNNTNVPYKEREIINKLKKTQNIMFLCQEKGRGIVIIDRKRYTYKCLNILNTEQFQKLDRDPTKPREAKIQRAIRKIKSHRSNQEYENLSNWLSTWKHLWDGQET